MNLLVNKTVKLNYMLLESYEAGIKLSGSEVKSLKLKNGSLKEAYVKIDNEVFLTNAFIPAFQPKHVRYENYDPTQSRKLLLTKNEIEKMKKSLKQKGYTLVPVRIYLKGKYIKIEVAIAKGKQEHDKRQSLREKSQKRDVARIMKDGQ